MKKALGVVLYGVAIATLGGCPLYSSTTTTLEQRVCTEYGCYRCPTSSFTLDCSAWICATSDDCPGSFACQNARCEPGGSPKPAGGRTDALAACDEPGDCASGFTCGRDLKCHRENCSVVSCPTGYDCGIQSGALACMRAPDADRLATTACASDATCAALQAGARCLDGRCAGVTDQCVLGAQCGDEQLCIDGACALSCDEDDACPTGYRCDTQTAFGGPEKGACVPSTPSCASGGPACVGTLRCVSGRCVPPCATASDCRQGLACVNGGCVVSQRPHTRCSDARPCATGGTCVRGSCFPSCGTTGGGGTNDAGAAPPPATPSPQAADAGAVGCGANATCTRINLTRTSVAQVCAPEDGIGMDCGVGYATCSGSRRCVDGLCK